MQLQGLIEARSRRSVACGDIETMCGKIVEHAVGTLQPKKLGDPRLNF